MGTNRIIGNLNFSPCYLYHLFWEVITITNEQCQKIALWRFGLIAPALNGTHSFPSNRAYFQNLALQKFTNPVSGQLVSFKPDTFVYWLWSYRKYGYSALLPGHRSDIGTFRALDQETQDEIKKLLSEYPRITNTAIRNKLKEVGLIDDSLSQSTIDRFVRAVTADRQLPEIHKGKDRRAFEYEFANQCWQADTTYLLKLKGIQLYLMLIIDDASRMVVGFDIFSNDSAVNFQRTLKKAISTYGKPTLLYCDNGAPYANEQLSLICAKTGIQLIHAPVRDGAAKGKIERLNKTIKMCWMNCTDWKKFEDIDQVKDSFRSYLFSEYINKPHSSLKKGDSTMTPRERFFQDEKRLKFIEADSLNECFLHECTRKVRTDSTVQVNKIDYEVPSELMREKITVYFDPFTEQAWFSTTDSDQKQPMYKVNKVENSHVRRVKKVSYGDNE